jgi:hypothetical protein
MARAERTETWTSSSDPTTLRGALDEFVKANAMKVVSDDGGTTSLKQGSQAATRLAGGWFINAAKLPKTATISLTPSERGTSISAHIEESLGFGLLDKKFKKKYEDYFDSWMAGLKSALS